MAIEWLCTVVVALILGAILILGGYRFFLIMLPIFGFFVGFALGAEVIANIFGTSFLADITGWITGAVVGIVFAVLSYLFWIIGVAIVSGAIGFALGTGVMYAIGLDPGFISWLVGIVVAAAVVLAVLMLNVQKYLIIVITSLGGAGLLIGGVMLMFGAVTLDQLSTNAVRAAIDNSWVWMLIFLVLAIAGVAWQIMSTRTYVWEVEESGRGW
jgi:hypothetical protein